ncbi:MAG: MFS transporter [Microbacterium sp.]
MPGYRTLLRTPSVGRIIAAQLAARFPGGMIALAVLMHVEHVHHSYGAAGTVLAAISIGQAIAGPITSRWMGRWGMRPVLTLTTLTTCLAIVLIALLPAPIPVLLILGLISGLASPPVQSAVRTIYPKLVNASQLTSLFSLDASLQEIIWVVGPVLITFVSLQISTVVGLLMIVVLALAGGTWFILSPELGRVRIPRSRRSLGKVLLKPTVSLTTVLGFLLIGACSAIEAGIVSAFGEGGFTGGIILAVFAVGSFAGGLVFGSVPLAPWSMARRFIIVAVGIGATLVSLHAVWLGGSLLVAGFGIAPILAMSFAITSASVKFSETAEAYGWINTGQLMGAALGSAIAGFTIDQVGSRGAFATAAGMVVLGLAISIVFVRALPDLRGRDASPIPDTEPIQTSPS